MFGPVIDKQGGYLGVLSKTYREECLFAVNDFLE